MAKLDDYRREVNSSAILGPSTAGVIRSGPSRGLARSSPAQGQIEELHAALAELSATTDTLEASLRDVLAPPQALPTQHHGNSLRDESLGSPLVDSLAEAHSCVTSVGARLQDIVNRLTV